jgi:hypothetical protein
MKDGREGRIHVLQALAPKPTTVQEELLVNIKVNFFPSARARISCSCFGTKVDVLEPLIGSGDFVHQ